LTPLIDNTRNHRKAEIVPEEDSMTKLSISKLIEMAKAVKMTEAQQEEQRRSFVYGNTAFENPAITRKMVDDIAEAMRA
jgi:hypothetical protein